VSGLSSYPRSYGTSIPAHVAERLRKYLPPEDQALYEECYRRGEIPSYLHPNHSDVADQPGAIPLTGSIPNPSLGNIAC
jgi:hypothetical protein